MYTNLWNKYLPVIRIFLKRALVSDQVLDLNVPDFEKAGMTRKTGYKFLIKFKNGRVEHIILNSPPASGLIEVLLQDPVVRNLMADHEYDISLNLKFQLMIKHITTGEQVPENVRS